MRLTGSLAPLVENVQSRLISDAGKTTSLIENFAHLSSLIFSILGFEARSFDSRFEQTFSKKKKESDCRTFRLSDRKDSRGIFLEYLSPFVSPLLSRITTRAKTSAKVTPVQSILRHIEPHLFARSNLENIHASFIPTVRSSFPILRPSFSSHVSLFCHSSVTAKSSVNKKGDTYVRNLLSDGADKKHLAHSFRSYRKHDWDCYPSSDS